MTEMRTEARSNGLRVARPRSKLAILSIMTPIIIVMLFATFATPQFLGSAEASGNPAPSSSSSALVYQWTVPSTSKVTLSLIDPKATPKFTIKLYGCWIWGEILGEAPGFIQGDWSSSPFYMTVKDSQIVKVKISTNTWVTPQQVTIDWNAGTLTVENGTPFDAVAVKFSIKQPPIHACGTIGNL